MTNIKISCIVPVYNTELFVAKCIKSILGQTYRNLELILIDDGSTDKSGVICDAFAETDDRVKVIHQKNSGVSSARNVGIKEATGEYLCFVDSDDYIENDYFELATKYLEKYNPVLMINNHIKDNIKDNRKDNIVLTVDNDGALWEMFSKKHFSWEPVACFYQTVVCKNITFDESICYGEDLLFKYNFIKKADNNIVYASLQKYHYVFRKDSACNSYNLLKKADDLKVLQFIVAKEDNELGKIVYRNEYIPRLIKYYRMGLLSKSLEEKELIGILRRHIKKNFRNICGDKKIKTSLKIKLIFLKILEWIYA